MSRNWKTGDDGLLTIRLNGLEFEFHRYHGMDTSPNQWPDTIAEIIAQFNIGGT